MTLKEMVSEGKKVYFEFYRNGILYYKTEDGFLFEIPKSDCGDACFNKEDRAILFMRWIRRQIQNNEEGKK